MFWCDFKCRWCSVWSCEKEECERDEGNMIEKVATSQTRLNFIADCLKCNRKSNME